eukprot:jgi/Tetstr1/455024/TSEL_041881.t1
MRDDSAPAADGPQIYRCGSLYTRFSTEKELRPESTWRDRSCREQAELAEWTKCNAQFNAGLAVPRGLNSSMNNPEGLPVCEPNLHYAHLLHDIEKSLAWFSVAILCTMLLENALLLLCLGVKEFCGDLFYMLDTFVVAISLAFELAALSGFLDQTTLGGLLIIGRTWRFARVAHGFYFLEHVEEKSESHSSSNLSRLSVTSTGI